LLPFLVRVVLYNNKPLRGANKKTLLFLEKEAKSIGFSLAGGHPQSIEL
jgi:hypothetical protein